MTKKQKKVEIPYNFTPRDYQENVYNEFKEAEGKRGVWVAHRRSGKDKTAMNILIRQMFKRIGTYYYLFPTYNQGRKIIWEGIDGDGFRFMDHFPKEVVRKKRDQDMYLELKNNSTFQIIGTDNTDRIVGTNPVGAIFSEYSLQDPNAWSYLRPIMAENNGWALFVYTPRGKNHGERLFRLAEESEFWFSELLTVEDTDAIDDEILAREKEEMSLSSGGDDALFMQEYYCSFEVPVQGSYYSKPMLRAEEEGRITRVHHDETLQVFTFWDLGIGDNTAIWFAQKAANEVRLIDYYETSGEGLAHYIKVLNERRDEVGYSYGGHYAPHDIEVKELGTGKSRREIASSLGLDFEVVPKLGIDDGIEAVRAVLGRCYFDALRCEDGLDALRSYRKKYSEKKQTFQSRPVHDWASHGADAFRYLALSIDDLMGEFIDPNTYNTGSDGDSW